MDGSRVFVNEAHIDPNLGSVLAGRKCRVPVVNYLRRFIRKVGECKRTRAEALMASTKHAQPYAVYRSLIYAGNRGSHFDLFILRQCPGGHIHVRERSKGVVLEAVKLSQFFLLIVIIEEYEPARIQLCPKITGELQCDFADADNLSLLDRPILVRHRSTVRHHVYRLILQPLEVGMHRSIAIIIIKADQMYRNVDRRGHAAAIVRGSHNRRCSEPLIRQHLAVFRNGNDFLIQALPCHALIRRVLRINLAGEGACLVHVDCVYLINEDIRNGNLCLRHIERFVYQINEAFAK